VRYTFKGELKLYNEKYKGSRGDNEEGGNPTENASGKKSEMEKKNGERKEERGTIPRKAGGG